MEGGFKVPYRSSLEKTIPTSSDTLLPRNHLPQYWQVGEDYWNMYWEDAFLKMCSYDITPTIGYSNFNITGFPSSAEYNFYGGCLATNEWLYFIPRDAPGILRFNTRRSNLNLNSTTNANDVKYNNMGVSLTDLDKWYGGSLAQNGKIYCAPFDATDILVIDPIKNTAIRTNMGLDLSGDAKWKGSVLAPDGKIYCIPYTATDFLIINPLEESAIRSTLGLDFSSAYGWESGILHANGKIYCPPNYWNTNFCIIDTKKSIATKETWGLSITANVTKWKSGVMASNRKIYLAPGSSSEPQLFIIDPDNNSASKLTISINNKGYNGTTLGADGNVYSTYPGTGQLVSDVSKFNIKNNSSIYWNSGLNVSTQSILVPSGKIIGFGNENNITVVDFKKEVPLNICLSPYLNKL